jgi:hypothetical protein
VRHIAFVAVKGISGKHFDIGMYVLELAAKAGSKGSRRFHGYARQLSPRHELSWVDPRALALVKVLGWLRALTLHAEVVAGTICLICRNSDSLGFMRTTAARKELSERVGSKLGLVRPTPRRVP